MEAPKDNLSKIGPAANVADDREAHPKFWIAAYTRPKSEKKAANDIAKAPNTHIRTYAPTQNVVRQWSDRKKIVEAVVIPMIIFAEVSDEEDIQTVKKHPLIIKVLSLPGHREAAHIPKEQIEQLRFMLSKSENAVEFVEGEFKKYDRVKVVKGRLSGLEGVVERTLTGESFIVVRIDILGGARVSVDPSELELLKNKIIN